MSKVVSADSPGSSLSTRAACSSSAQVRSSRIACMACVVSDQMPRRMLRRSSNTVRPSRRRMMRSPRCTRPSARTVSSPRPWRPSTSRTRATSPARTATTAPSSSANSAGERIVAQAADLDVQADATRERHLGQRHEHAAVAAIVVRGERARRGQLLDRGEKALEQRWIVEVGRRLRRSGRRPAPARTRPAGSCRGRDRSSSSSPAPSSPSAASSGVSTRRTSVTGATRSPPATAAR